MGKIKGFVIQEFVWRSVYNNGKKINEVDSGREHLKQRKFWKRDLDKDNKAGFSDVSNFPFSNPILLRGVRTRHSIGNTMEVR